MMGAARLFGIAPPTIPWGLRPVKMEGKSDA